MHLSMGAIFRAENQGAGNVQPVILAYTVIYILVFIVAFSFFGVPKEHDRTTTERIPDNGLSVKIAVE